MFEDSIPYSGDDNMNYPDYEDMLLYASSEDTDWDSILMHYPLKDYSIWTTKGGTKIPIKDMTTKHLKNAVKMICRNSSVESCFLNMIKELINRNEF